MGWCSGTDVFDPICALILRLNYLSQEQQVEILVAMINAFEDRDWDCQQDSKYWHHPVMMIAMRRVHPDWYEEETEE